SKGVEKGKVTETLKASTLAQLSTAHSLSELSDADIVVEAIVENLQVKEKLFYELDSLCAPETILASNTSSISITKIAAATNRPERVIGLHFMNPVPVMQLVEIIRGLQTSDDTYARGKAAVELLGKTPVTARRDFPGFIVNRILVPMINEAFFVLMEGIATPEEIDEAMKLGTNQ
ncbi:MAG: 3-hydroxybutyryl-CoA dehydrogenase, partial [Bdellovibrionales bacterium]|nr:3-hydroxybutyryl-CoA dehydrogenase [Bdellovibrionales bacterium]